jgi:hypothetical protein
VRSRRGSDFPWDRYRLLADSWVSDADGAGIAICKSEDEDSTAATASGHKSPLSGQGVDERAFPVQLRGDDRRVAMVALAQADHADRDEVLAVQIV